MVNPAGITKRYTVILFFKNGLALLNLGYSIRRCKKAARKKRFQAASAVIRTF
jgi:hypothetical protein